MNAGAISIVLLAPSLLLAKATYIKTEARLDIHAKLKARMSLINLQTISDIFLDLFRTRSVLPVTDCRHKGGLMNDSIRSRVVYKLSRVMLPLALTVALSGCGGDDVASANGWMREGPGYRVTRAGFEARKLTWPFTVDEGVIGCDREALWFVSGADIYALNGWAVELLGYEMPYDIWQFNEDLKAAAEAAGLEPQARINIGDVLTEARKFCTNAD